MKYINFNYKITYITNKKVRFDVSVSKVGVDGRNARQVALLISPNSILNKTILGSEKKITDENVKISFLIFISFFLSLFIL